MTRRPTRSTRADTHLPCTSRFRAWHVRPGQVRKLREHPVEPLAQRALGLLRRRDFLLEDLHLGDQIGCIFAAFLRRTNRLGYFVAALLHLLEFRLRGAPPSLQLQHRLYNSFKAPRGVTPGLRRPTQQEWVCPYG